MFEIKVLSIFQGNSQSKEQKLDFEIVLQNKHSSFYALVTSTQRYQRMQRRNKEKDIITIMLQS